MTSLLKSVKKIQLSYLNFRKVSDGKLDLRSTYCRNYLKQYCFIFTYTIHVYLISDECVHINNNLEYRN